MSSPKPTSFLSALNLTGKKKQTSVGSPQPSTSAPDKTEKAADVNAAVAAETVTASPLEETRSIKNLDDVSGDSSAEATKQGSAKDDAAVAADDADSDDEKLYGKKKKKGLLSNIFSGKKSSGQKKMSLQQLEQEKKLKAKQTQQQQLETMKRRLRMLQTDGDDDDFYLMGEQGQVDIDAWSSMSAVPVGVEQEFLSAPKKKTTAATAGASANSTQAMDSFTRREEEGQYYDEEEEDMDEEEENEQQEGQDEDEGTYDGSDAEPSAEAAPGASEYEDNGNSVENIDGSTQRRVKKPKHKDAGDSSASAGAFGQQSDSEDEDDDDKPIASRSNGIMGNSLAAEITRMARKFHPQEQFDLLSAIRGLVGNNNQGFIADVVIQHEKFCLVTSNHSVLYGDTSSSAQVLRWTLPVSQKSTTVYRTFMSPIGVHIIVSMNNGENFYINAFQKEKMALKLQGLEGKKIGSIGFDPRFYSLSFPSSFNPDNPPKPDPKLSAEARKKHNKIVEHISGFFDSTKVFLLGLDNMEVWSGCIERKGNRKGIDFSQPPKKIYGIKELFYHEKILKRDLRDEDFPITGLEIVRRDSDCSVLVSTAVSIMVFEGYNTKDYAKIFADYSQSIDEIDPRLPASRFAVPKDLDDAVDAHSELHLIRSSEIYGVEESEEDSGLPTAFSWMTSIGVMHGKFYLDGKRMLADENTHLLPFAVENERPLSIAVSDFHTFILYPSRLHIVMQPPELSSVSGDYSMLGKVVYSDSLTETLERIGDFCRLCKDTNSNEIFVVTDTEVYSILRNEDVEEHVGIWKLYLEQANTSSTSKRTKEFFDKALALATTNEERNIVLSARGDFYFADGQLEQAAVAYSKTRRPFEDVLVKFMEADPNDDQNGLQTYVYRMLKRVNKDRKMELVCLATYLAQLYLHKISMLTKHVFAKVDENITPEEKDIILQAKKRSMEQRSQIRSTFREFLSEFKDTLALCKETIFDMILGNGMTNDYIFFATLVGDYEKAIQNCIACQDYAKALAILEQFCVDRAKHEHIWYKYSPMLMSVTRDRNRMLRSFKNRFLNPAKLVPALLKCLESTETDHEQQPLVAAPVGQSGSSRRSALAMQRRSVALTLDMGKSSVVSFAPGISSVIPSNHPVVKYIDWAIDMKLADGTVHNLQVYLLSRMQRDDELNRFLRLESSDQLYNKDYALRVCLENRKYASCVKLYTAMGLFDNAVDLALTFVGVDEAVSIVRNFVEDKDTKRRLLLKIISFLVKLDQVQSTGDQRRIDGRRKALGFLQQYGDIIRLDDILHFFPNTTILEDFKDQIEDALRAYNLENHKLRQQMLEAANEAESVRDAHTASRCERDISPEDDKCSVCNNALLSQECYFFTCGHQYHENCLAQVVTDGLRKILAMRTEYGDEDFNLHHNGSPFYVETAAHSIAEINEMLEKIQSLRDTVAFIKNHLAARRYTNEHERIQLERKLLRCGHRLGQIIGKHCPHDGPIVVEMSKYPLFDADSRAEEKSWRL